MKLTDLKAGMRVETRNGVQGLIIKNGEGTLYLFIKDQWQDPIRIGTYYTSEFTVGHTANDHHNDIMKMWFENRFSASTACDLANKVTVNPDWERKEVVKITMASALETLKRALDGTEVEIIDETLTDKTSKYDWHVFDELGLVKGRYEQYGAKFNDFVLLKGHNDSNGLELIYCETRLVFCEDGILYPREKGRIGRDKITHFKLLPGK